MKPGTSAWENAKKKLEELGMHSHIRQMQKHEMGLVNYYFGPEKAPAPPKKKRWWQRGRKK